MALAPPAGPAYAVVNAAPVAAPAARTQAAAPSESPLTGPGLTLDLERALDLEEQGVATTAVNGAAMERTTSEGGAQLPKGGKRVVTHKVRVDVRSGAATGQVGASANVRIDTVNEPGTAEFVKPARTADLRACSRRMRRSQALVPFRAPLPRHKEVDLTGPDLQVAQAVGRRAHLAGEVGRRPEGLLGFERAGGDDGVAVRGDPDPYGHEAGLPPHRLGDLVALGDELLNVLGGRVVEGNETE